MRSVYADPKGQRVLTVFCKLLDMCVSCRQNTGDGSGRTVQVLPGEPVSYIV